MDMVANAMLAAMAKHACRPGLEVYQVASSTLNPFPVSSFKRFMEEHFQEQPFLDSMGKPIRNSKFQLYPDVESFIEALYQLASENEVHIINFIFCNILHTSVTDRLLSSHSLITSLIICSHVKNSN